MGWVSELELIDRSFDCGSSPSTSRWRWLSRFVIVKGGHMYMFKQPPIFILKDIKQKLVNFAHRNHSGSTGSSLGSAGSSGSDASNLSITSFHFNEKNDSNDLLTKLRKTKSDRLVKLNKEFEKELIILSKAHYCCYKSDFRCIRPNELHDEKLHCFMVFSSTLNKQYFSTENESDLENLKKAWACTNYNSVTKLKV